MLAIGLADAVPIPYLGNRQRALPPFKISGEYGRDSEGTLSRYAKSATRVAMGIAQRLTVTREGGSLEVKLSFPHRGYRSMAAKDSVSQWIVGAQHGAPEAVHQLWQRYFERLVRLARVKLAGAPRRVADEEDIALSAFASFCRAAKQGRFPRLSDRQGLWQLLLTITAQKAVDQARHACRKKRGGGRVRGESALVKSDMSSADQGLAQVIGDTPTPEFAAIVAEECRRLLNTLDADLRPVAVAKMEQYINEEIATQLGCSISTVERSLRLIRRIWKRSGGAESGASP